MDPNYEKSLTVPSPDGPQFRPTKGLLVVTGVFVILSGVLLCAGGWLYGVKMPGFINASSGGNSPLNGAMNGVFSSVGIMLGLTGLGLAVLGAGSIALRKWARDLLLALGWLLIALAILMVISMMLTIPQMLAMSREMARAVPGSPVPGGPSVSGFMMIGLAVGMVFYLLLIGGPGTLLVTLLRAKNVELTTRYYHQAPSWTEKCHTSVLVLWLAYALAIISVVSMFFGYIPLALAMKLIPSAQAGYLFLGITTVILVVIAYGVSQAAPWSWWATIGYAIAWAALGYYYFHAFDWAELSRLTWQDFPDSNDELAKIMQRQQSASIKSALYSSALIWVAGLVWIVLIRKHFGIGKQTTSAPATNL